MVWRNTETCGERGRAGGNGGNCGAAKLQSITNRHFWMTSCSEAFPKRKKAVKFRSCNKNQFTLKEWSQLTGKKNLVFSIFSNTGTNCSFLNWSICRIFFSASSSPPEICKHQQRESLFIHLFSILVDCNITQRVSEVHSVDSWKQCVPYSQHLAGGRWRP